MSFFRQMDFHGDANIGLYGFATDSYCLCGAFNEKIKKSLKEILGVKVFNSHLLGIEFLKIFSTGNSSGIILSKIIPRDEINELKKKLPIDVFVSKSDYAIGNMILMNDKGMILSPVLKNHKKDFENLFNIGCEISTIAKLNVIGSLGIATNKGCLVHPHVTDEETEILQSTLNVNVEIGTVNFGSMYPGSGVIANSNGFIASRKTSGPELGRITEALDFL